MDKAVAQTLNDIYDATDKKNKMLKNGTLDYYTQN